MLPVKQDVIDLIDSRVESFDLRQQMSNYIARQAAKCNDGGKVKGKEIALCHFLMPIEGSLGER
jgi:hypothetical protein